MSLTAPSSPHADLTPSGDDAALQILDAAGAMALLDDSVELYLDIATAFQQEISDFPARVAALMQTNLADATRALHTIKGLSLTVGANRLSAVCRQGELTLKEVQKLAQPLDATGQRHIVESLEPAIAQTLEALQQTLTDLAAPSVLAAAPQTASPAQLQTLISDLQTLRKLLVQSDLQALDVFVAMLSRHTGLDETLQGLDQALKAFDFGKAVVQCDELIRRFGTTH